MVTIERLNKQNKGLEDKLKDTKRKNKEEKTTLNQKIEEFESVIEVKNVKLMSLKDTLVEQFKHDIEKLKKSFENKENNLEMKLAKSKDEEIEKVAYNTEKQYQDTIESLEKSLHEQTEKLKESESFHISKQNHTNLKIKYENEDKLKILKENKATF
jgi:hypothetical protein